MAPKRAPQVLARPTKEQRQAERKAIGSLKQAQVSKQTLGRYTIAVERFLSFLSSMSLPYPKTFARLDSVFAEFIESCWEQGDPKSYVGNALSGLIFFIPNAKGQMNESWRLHATWGRAEMPDRAPPMTLQVCYAFCWFFRSKGYLDSIVLFCLGFHTFARSGELFSAQKSHFAIDDRTGEGVWRLPLTKSGQRAGVEESITINDPWVGHLIKQYCSNLQPGDTLCQVSQSVQRARLSEAIDFFKLTIPFRWYSLRRGGATHEFRISANLPQVMIRGRWGSQRTARIYLTEGLARIQDLQISARTRATMRRLALEFRPGLDL